MKQKSRISIGKSEPENGSVLLDFGPKCKRNHPSISSKWDNCSRGTFVVNLTEGSLRFLDGKDSTLENLVAHNYSSSGKEVGAGVVIGVETSNKSGVWVLASTTQALVLPKVENPHDNIIESNGAHWAINGTQDFLFLILFFNLSISSILSPKQGR